MDRVLLLVFFCLPILLLQASPGSAASDHALIESLEAADSAREKQDILSEIARRTADGPLSVELTDRLIVELMSDELYGYHHIMKSLPELGGERGYSEQSLLTLAEGLSGNINQQYTPARSISRTLSLVHSTDGLPDAAFAALTKALEHVAMLNRSAAIEVLAASRHDDRRYPAAIQAIVSALVNNDHNHTRSAAIAGLTQLAGDLAMTPDTIEVLVSTAVNDPYISVRIDAMEALAAQALDRELGEKLAMSLAGEIITPTVEVWQRKGGSARANELNDRAAVVLGELIDPPYPDYIIAAWITQARSYEPDRSLAALRRVFERGELSHDQIAELVEVGKRHRRAMEREKVYAMLFVELQAGTLMDALIGFESSEDEAARIRAGYALKQQYQGREVPERVADVAARVSVGGSNAELRAIGASLLSNTNVDREKREGQLISALKRHPHDADIYTAIVDMFGPARLDELIVEYAGNDELSINFRRHIVSELGRRTVTDDGLSPGAESVLKDIARNAEDYYLVQYAGDTLEAWGVSAPLRVALRNHENQSKVLFAVLVVLVLTNVIAIFSALIGIFRIPIQTDKQRKRLAMRTAMFSGWLVMTIGILVLLAGGAVGFLGHNSAPKPEGTLLWNLPAYAGSVVYLFLTRLVWRQVRKETTISA